MRKNKLPLTLAAALICGSALYSCKMSQEHKNPFLETYTTPFEIPPFPQMNQPRRKTILVHYRTFP